MKFPAFILAIVAAILVRNTSEGRRLFQIQLGRDNHSRNLADATDVDLDALYQARGVQYVDLKVGCPAQSQSAIISTASPAIGFPCSGCDNDCGEGSHLNGLYHEKQSSCFSEVACNDCKLSSSTCAADHCSFSIFYEEGSSWHGVEVEDMVSVGGEDSDEEAFPLHFGCQDDITGLFEKQIPDGIFGMNKDKGSAISQWSDMGYLDVAAFSLCYNVREDVKEKSGVMMLGGADKRLHKKPMVFAKDVGQKNYEVRIKKLTFRRGPGLSASAGGIATSNLNLDGPEAIIIDSATTCTNLNHEWHGSLKEAWRQTTGGKFPMFSHLSITDEEINELPTLVFELEGEVDTDTITIEYPPIRYMEKSYSGGWDFCLSASESYSNVLGNTFMAGHDVLHDLDKKRIGFAESTCEPSVVQISVQTDAMNNTLAPFVNFTPVVLQSEPIYKRQTHKHVNPTSAGMNFFYAAVAVAVVVLAFVLCYRYRRQDMPFWTEPNTKHAYQLSWISLVVTVLAIAAGGALFASTGSSLFLVLSLENCVDFLSSAVVLWRFFAPSDVTEKLEAKLKSREERASVAISMILVVLGVGIWVTAIQDLLRGQEEQDDGQQKTALAISFFSFFFFGILTVFKFHYAKVLDSPSLYKDGMCSLIGTILSVSLFIDTIIIKAAPSVWMIDPIVAIGCGFVSLIYGMWVLYVARYRYNLPILSAEWWSQSNANLDEPVELKTETAMDKAAAAGEPHLFA